MITGAIASMRLVVAREQERQRAAVRPAGDTDAGVAGPVLLDVGTLGEPVDELPGVRDLGVGRVERDLPARSTRNRARST